VNKCTRNAIGPHFFVKKRFYMMLVFSSGIGSTAASDSRFYLATSYNSLEIFRFWISKVLKTAKISPEFLLRILHRPGKFATTPSLAKICFVSPTSCRLLYNILVKNRTFGKTKILRKITNSKIFVKIKSLVKIWTI